MGKFKVIFYSIYIAFFSVCVFVTFTYEDLVLRWDWDFIDTWTGLIKFVLKLGAIGTLLFGVSLIVENVHITQLKKKISDLQKRDT